MRRVAVEKLEGGNEDPATKKFRILAEIMKLRRFCCNPKLVVPECGLHSSKLQLFEKVMDELLANRHKSLVFSQFTDHLGIISELLSQKNVRFQYLDGSTPIAQRKQAVEAFQRGEGDVFLISLRAGGLGLNLTAADYVIHLDPWWNPAVEDQASDRSHRMGQQRPVTVYRLVTADTIEDKIVRLHSRKRDLADSLLEGTDTTAHISFDEIMQLLSDTDDHILA